MFLASAAYLLILAKNGGAVVFLWELTKAIYSSIDICFIVDLYRVGFLMTVRVISARVYIFSTSYINQEKFFLRFHLLVFSFVASITLLILSPNLIRILLGWDGLGVTSYLLVVYFQRTKSYNAGMVTALRNRVGDVLILLAIATIARTGRWNFVVQRLGVSRFLRLTLVLLTVAACTKSAQIPFSAWLPAAMAAPTPVSSLVHSSTLVTAGVYLLFRFSHTFAFSTAKLIVLSLGALTILIAGLAALFEIDIKKIIALSTLSQLGVIILTLGIGAHLTGYFHMLSHAFFKALLFMTIGAIIHIANDYQDLRKTRILPSFSPLTLAFSLGANLRLCGLPFLRGFYSKDLCIELEVRNIFSLPLTLIFYLATGLTAAYTTRLIKLVLSSSEKSPAINWARDKDTYINLSMIVLFLLSVIGSGCLSWMLYFTPIHPSLATNVKLLVLQVILLSVGFAMFRKTSGEKPHKIKLVYLQMWGLPFITTQIGVCRRLILASNARNLGDLFWTPKLLGDPIFLNMGFKARERARLNYSDLFRSLSFLLLITIGILLYLHVINFFIKPKVKT